MTGDPVALVRQRHIESHQAGALNMWTVYDRPKDFPEKIVARRFVLSRRDGLWPTNDMIGGATLDEIRQVFTLVGLTRLPRNEADEPQIVETWL